MVKKILFILICFFTLYGFSQQKPIDGLTAAPNPFINTTNIHFTSKTSTTITFTVKNILGKTVFKKQVVVKKGNNSFPFSKNNLASGIYIYAIKSKQNNISKRFVIK